MNVVGCLEGEEKGEWREGEREEWMEGWMGEEKEEEREAFLINLFSFLVE